MKKLSLFFSMIFLYGIINAQTIKFSEDFETLPLTVTSSGNGNWARSSVYHYSGVFSDSSSLLSAGDTNFLVTNSFSTTGFSNVMLKFNHICKLAFYDAGYIEISLNGGTSWSRITGANYLGNGQFSSFGNKFNAASYSTIWELTNNNAVPQSSWWRGELFDLGNLAANATSVQIRFVIADGNNNGGDGNYGWLIDDIEVIAANGEMIPPSIVYKAPYVLDTIYSTGPYNISAFITDNSGIASAKLVYEILGVYDTINMANTSDSTYKATIPSYPYLTTICYHIVATDSSSIANIGYNPIGSCISYTGVRDPSLPTPYHYDVSVDTILTPLNTVISNQAENINIRIANRGDSLITKTTIGWSIDGIVQTPYVWTGSLQLDMISNIITIGTATFTGGSSDLKIWSYLPNDSTDQNATNDTVTKSTYACGSIMNGTYTLGGASADFNTFADLINQLNYCGLSGNSTVLVNPGTYNEQIIFSDSIYGLDSLHTLTIISSTNNPNDVIVEYSPGASSYVLGFIGSKFITVKGLTIKSLSTAASAVGLSGGASRNTIENCNISAPEGNNSTLYTITSTAEDNNYNNFIGNTITGGYYSMFINGSSSHPGQGNMISSNHISKFYRTGVYAYYQNNMVINYNKIKKEFEAGSPLISTLYLNYTSGVEVIGNESYIHTNGTSYGFYFYNASGTINKPSKCYNNISMVNGISTQTSYRAMYITTTSYLNVYNNTFATYSGAANTEAVYVSNSGKSDVNFRNNIMANFGGNYALEVTSSSTTSISEMDNNSYYTSGSVIMNWGGTGISNASGIAGIRLATLRDTNSLITNPMLYSLTNGRSFSQHLYAAGVPISGLTHDIDMKLRSATSPSIGASEFTVANIDIGVLEILNPLPIDTQWHVLNLKAVIRNFGMDTIYSSDIKYSLNNGTPVNSIWTGVIYPAQIDTVTLASVTLPVLNYQLKVYTALNGDTNYFNDTLSVNYYALPLVELSISGSTSPSDGCNKGANEIVKVTIANNGVQNISSGVTVSYQIVGNSTAITDTIYTTITAGTSLVHQFSQNANMTPGTTDSIFNFIFSVNHNLDANHYNDTLNESVISLAFLPSPTISDVTINYGSAAVLVATSSDPVSWFATQSSANALASGLSFTTPLLYDTAEYWLQSNTNAPATSTQVGTGTNMFGQWDAAIYGGGMGSGKYQILYSAADLIAAGLSAGPIESMAFQTAGAFTGPSTFDMSLALVSNSSFASTSFLNPTFTSVYSQAQIAGVAGWNTHTFTTPFIWDGTSSILVQICAAGVSYGGQPVMYTTTTSNTYIGLSGIGTSCASPAGGANTMRPNAKFNKGATLGCSSLRVPVTVNVPLPQFDGRVSEIVSPKSNCGLAQTEVTIDIVNMGTDTIAAGYTVTYKVDNGAYITPETINVAINPADTFRYTFNTLASLSPGTAGTLYKITAKVIIPTDTYHPNDSLIQDSILSKYTPSNPILTNLSVIYGSSASLSGIASDSIYWYADSLASQFVGTGNPYITGPLYDSTTFWALTQKNIPTNDYQIGNGTITSGTNGPSPYGSSSLGTRHQFIIKASELTALGVIQGNINSVSFYVSNVKSNLMQNYQISIGNTDYSDMNKTYFDSTLTQVFGPITYMESYGWNTHTFSSPYYWDGVSNLIIETSFKGSIALSYVGVLSTATSFVSTAQSQGFTAFSTTDPLINNKFSQRPNIKLNQEGMGLCQSDILPLEVIITNFPSIDASISKIVEPTLSASRCVPSPVKVILKNYGLNNLTSATINWQENNIAQIPYSWSGNLASGASDTITITSAHTFMGGVTTLKVWSSVTNDLITFNDTSTHVFDVVMSGNYSIGQVNSRYLSFTSAISDLTICGMCGPVVFNVDSGSYTERITLPVIAGNNSLNTITFQSANGDSTSVNLKFATNTIYNFVFLIDAAQYVSIKNMTITSLGATYANGIVLRNGAHHIDIRNNILVSSLSNYSSGEASSVSVIGHSAKSITVDNNYIYGGLSGVHFEHGTYGQITNIKISNNTFDNYSVYGNYFSHVDSVETINNSFTDEGFTAGPYGIYGYSLRNGFKFIGNRINLIGTSAGYAMYINGAGTATNRALIANNMVSLNTGTGPKYGLYLSSGSYVDIAYNSYNTVLGSVDSKALYFSGGSNLKLINNNVSAMYGYALYLSDPNAFIQMDYNNLYTDTLSSKFVRWGATELMTLSSLQVFDPTKNVHTKRIAPLYYSNTNLHTLEIELYNGGTYFSRVLNDFDGDIRSLTAPSIGADEFSPPAIDLAAISLSAPIVNSCNFSTSESIVVTVKNYGLNNLDFSSNPATITVIIDGQTLDTINYTINTGTLNSGISDNYTVSTNYDLSVNGSYYFSAFISVTGDGNHANDTMAPVKIISYPIINSFPFSDDFESGENISFLTTKALESDVNLSQFAGNNSFYGIHFEGGAYSAWTNSTTVDQAFANTSHVATAYSCSVDASTLTHLNLKFDLRQTAYDIISLNTSWFRVILTDANGSHYLHNIAGDSVFKPLTVDADPFVSHTFSMDSYTGQIFSISFEAANRYAFGLGSYDGDNVLIDNILIWEPNPKDIGVNSIVQEAFTYQSGHNTIIKALVENYGIDTLTNIPLAYQVDNGAIIRDTLFSALAPFNQIVFTFSQPHPLALGKNKVTVFSEYPNDIDHNNDTASIFFGGMKTFYPNYEDNFDQSNNWLSNGNNNQWEKGTPSTSHINTAHSGTKSWATVLNANHQSASEEYLYTPFFHILPNTDSVTVEFWQYMRVLPGQAAGSLQYSLNGVVWNLVGYQGIINSQNWYNTNTWGAHNWNKMDTNWVHSWVMLDPSIFNLGSQVQFRFKFEAISNGQTEEG